MARRAKVTENLEGHRTKDELRARTEAEEGFLDGAGALDAMRCPELIEQDTGAKRYWRTIVERMEDVILLDRLDTEVLGMYCSQLSRRDGLMADLAQAESAADRAEAESAIQKLEKSLLSYAKELGLTPAGRASLARKKAAESNDPNDELFG